MRQFSLGQCDLRCISSPAVDTQTRAGRGGASGPIPPTQVLREGATSMLFSCAAKVTHSFPLNVLAPLCLQVCSAQWTQDLPPHTTGTLTSSWET
jgi:hypothetical protein